jgi:lipid A 3-O-deacylase
VILRLALALFLGLAGSVAVADSPRVIASLGQQMTTNDPEAYLRYMGAPLLYGVQPVLGLSVAANGAGWIGAGAAYTYRPEIQGLFLRVSSMAGLYRKGAGKDLHGPVQFRTALDLGITQPNGMEYGIGADHRSSARIYQPNPGLNTLYLFASVPLR